MNYKDFLKKVKKVDGKRNHKVKNSYGVRDAFLFYRKIRPKEKQYVLSDVQYFKIIRTINNKLKEQFLQGKDIIFPERMGKLELKKRPHLVYFNDKNRLVITNPINWQATLKLWYDDEEAFNKKILIREESKESFRVKYDKYNATYNNKAFYKFSINRDLKVKLKEQINNNKIDAFQDGKTIY